MIAAMTRHLKSLRYMQRDHGWIHTLLEEAENERMHLLTSMELRKPGPVFKFMVVGAQGWLLHTSLAIASRADTAGYKGDLRGQVLVCEFGIPTYVGGMMHLVTNHHYSTSLLAAHLSCTCTCTCMSLCQLLPKFLYIQRAEASGALSS